MNSQLIDFDRILLILFAFLLLRVCWQLYAPRLRRRWRKAKARLARRRKPRSPKDCPHCCQGLSLEFRPIQRIVKGVSAFQGLEFRTTWLRSCHFTGALLACWMLFSLSDQLSAVKPIIRRSQLQDPRAGERSLAFFVLRHGAVTFPTHPVGSNAAN